MSEPRNRDETPPRAPWRGRAIMHVDMDAFFASVEQLDHPEWRGLPVVVGGSPDHRGVIAAASYEARTYGVRSAMPAARAARLLPPDAVWTRGNFARYGEVSRQVFDILRTFSPDVQVASIDEAYLDVTPGAHSPHPLDVAHEIQNRVDALGVTCSIGLATGRTIAKIASDLDKPHGLTVVWPGEEKAFLAPLPIELMPGVGPATATRLRALGIDLLGDLAALDRTTAEQILGSRGMDVVRRSAGVDGRGVHAHEPAKSVSSERTFSDDLRDRKELRAAASELVERVAMRLRRGAVKGRTIQLKLRFADFTTITAQETLASPSSATRTIRQAVMRLLDANWAAGVGVRLLGVGVSGFEEQTEQLELSEEGTENEERLAAVEDVVDRVRERFGERAVSQGAHPPRTADESQKYGPASGPRTDLPGRSSGKDDQARKG